MNELLPAVAHLSATYSCGEERLATDKTAENNTHSAGRGGFETLAFLILNSFFPAVHRRCCRADELQRS